MTYKKGLFKKPEKKTTHVSDVADAADVSENKLLKLERVAADLEVIPSNESALRSMTNNHLAMAAKAKRLADLGYAIMEQYTKNYADGIEMGKPPLTADDLVKLTRLATDLDRQSHGAASKIQEKKEANYSRLTTEQLIQLNELMRIAEGDDDE